MSIAGLFLLISSIQCQLNFYLDSDAVHEIFGINDFRLYFVQNNQIRSSALESSIQIPSNIPLVQLTWQMEKTKLNYEYNSSSNNDEALLPPVLNIIERGLVPRISSNFNIFFPCLSAKSVNSSVTFHFSYTNQNLSTIITMKFLKTCRNEIVNRSFLLQFFDSNQVNDYFSIREFRSPSFASTALATILGYSLVIASLVFLLVFCTAMSFFCMYRLTRTATKKKNNSESLLNNQHVHPLTLDMTTFEDVSLYSCTQYGFLKTADELLSSSILTDCTIDANRVILHETILEGKFGRVIRCSLTDGSSNNQLENIFGKTLQPISTPIQLNDMLNDCCLFARLKHSTINSPLGIVYKEEFSPFPMIIYPYSNKGLLKTFLIKNRISAREQMLSTQELVYMAIHIGKGLHFLHRRKMLMKDIGTRNCLLMEDLTVKLTDYALSRDIFPEDYYCVQTEICPLKSMAIESIKDRRFSTASDVWSYGVLLWELMTRGLQPYADVDPNEFFVHLQNNHRLTQPINCPDSLFKLMSICWTASIDQRPSMTSLLQSLMEFYGQLARFI